ncbi:MAG: hypothetical protein OJF49_003807 [Ktedonobacterales bacterium]|jgi:hypothetical protein|nr:MAG: hypothetical protein OJF49_003807 [Ktedonobacterales bacterium]
MMDDNDMQTLRDMEPDWQMAQIGTPVFTSDGEQLGMVVGKMEEGLLIRGERGRSEEYLAPPADISRIEANGIYLLVTREQAMRPQT